jgi:hypothetical protein
MHHALAQLDILTCITEAIHWSDAQGPRTERRAHIHTDSHGPSFDKHPSIASFRSTCKSLSSVGKNWLYEHLVFAERSVEEFIPPRISIAERIADYLSFCERDGDVPGFAKQLTVVCCRDRPKDEDHLDGVELAQASPGWLTSKAFKSVMELLARASTVVKLEVNMGLSGGGTEGVLISQRFTRLSTSLEHLHLSDIEGLPSSFVLNFPHLKTLKTIRVSYVPSPVGLHRRATLDSLEHYGADLAYNPVLRRLDLSGLTRFATGTCRETDINTLAVVLERAEKTLKHLKVDFTSLESESAHCTGMAVADVSQLVSILS